MTTPPHIEKAARLAYNASVNNETDDGWWDKFTEGEREEWRRATLAVLSTTKEPSDEEVLAAAIEMWHEVQTEADEIGMPFPPPSSFDEMPPDDKPRFLRIARAGLVAAATVRNRE